MFLYYFEDCIYLYCKYSGSTLNTKLSQSYFVDKEPYYFIIVETTNFSFGIV